MSASTERPAARPWDEETDRDAVWEPAGLAFRVGDRVRIRLSGECPEHHGKDEDQVTVALLDGRVGTVRAIDGALVPGHPLKVVIDEAYPGLTRFGDRRQVGGSWCAPSELVPLPADPAPAEGEGR